MSVVIETTKGDITVDLYTAERPKACLNFLKLCKQKMYNNNLFHMIQNNFIAQTGDPSETGRGGDSIFYHLYGDQARLFEAESNPRIKHTKQGQLSMVNCGENMLGSQFFLTLSEDLDYLDGEHCVFGEVVEGFDIVEVLNETICDSDHRPYQDVRITHMAVLHDPFDDPVGLEPRADSPEPSKELLKNSRIGADENINDYAGKTEEEINEIIAGKEANARATILEMVGDLPDADCAPPENVLFVCKLNPVTNDDDLEIIFSRFGKVKCCEVIRDKKSGESLQYAFVEFEEENACESAYFKMDNVLIDDRRIHVDFSQSVSKFQWKGKGRLEVKDEKENKKPNGGETNKGFNSNKDNKDVKQEQDEDRKYSRKGQGILNLGGKPKDRAVERDNKDRRDERDNKDRRDERDYRDKRDDGNRKDGREERDNRDRKVEKDHTERRVERDNGDRKVERANTERRVERDNGDRKVERDNRDSKEERTNRDNREERDDKDRRGERDSKDRRDERYNKDRRDERDNRNRRDERDNRDRKGERHNNDRRDERDNKDRRGERDDDKRKERSNDYKNSTKDKRNNTSKYDQRSEKKDDRERLEKRKYPEERSKTKDKRDASSSETDKKRHHKKSKKKSKRSKSDSSSSDSSSSESD